MPLLKVTREWEGQDAYLIGGGSSLKNFDFTRLLGKNVIGCNDAFRLGPEIVPICIFGDAGYFHQTGHKLEHYKGKLITCAPALAHINVPWLHYIPRIKSGLPLEGPLGWNGSTGAVAINLALRMGASRVFLLGYDLCLVDGQSHWHNHNEKATRPESFFRFSRGFDTIAQELKSNYPKCRVYNVTDGRSELQAFPRVRWEVDRPVPTVYLESTGTTKPPAYPPHEDFPEFSGEESA